MNRRVEDKKGVDGFSIPEESKMRGKHKEVSTIYELITISQLNGDWKTGRVGGRIVSSKALQKAEDFVSQSKGDFPPEGAGGGRPQRSKRES